MTAIWPINRNDFYFLYVFIAVTRIKDYLCLGFFARGNTFLVTDKAFMCDKIH